MSLPSLAIIKNWKIADLKSWLSDPMTQEGWDYDFKVDLPDSRNDREKGNLRACYCSFANSRDGMIFYGVDDNKGAQGLSYDQNFKNRISHILTSEIYPPIKEWDLFHVVFTNPRKNRCVYLIFIKESFYSEKPHITDGRVWVRENGHRDYIKTGIDIQRHFLIPDKLFPRYSDVVIRVFENIKNNYQGHVVFLDVMILQRFKVFLQESCTNDIRRDVYAPLLNDLGDLETRMPTLSEGYMRSLSIQGNDWQNRKNEVDNIAQRLIDTLRKIN
ncbi:MAG: hypothetical protein UV70_C0013G0006 [Parcubacteria group bacterium GW2011_GWA2_43_13]|nr:MAG: hypothetical protein UV70_C0013G0006 [Parcubacteria group bacterium GW2011_GWA2_43_13]